MNTPTPAQALGEVMADIQAIMGARNFTITKFDNGDAEIAGPKDFMLAVVKCLDLVITHGQHFAGLERDLDIVRGLRLAAAQELGLANKRVIAAEARCAELEALATLDADAKSAGFASMVEAVYAGIDSAKGADAGFVVSAYRHGEGMGNDVTVERVRQLEGRDLWAVRRSGWGDSLSVTGEWDAEPFPSSRTSEWISSHRFASARDAIAAFLAANGD